MGGGSSNNIWTSWFGHIIPAGTNIVTGTMIRHGDPGDPDLPEDFSLPSSKHGNYPPAYPIPPVKNSIDLNIAARVGAIGPAPNPANNQYLALESYKYLGAQHRGHAADRLLPACTPQTRARVGLVDSELHWPSSSIGLGGAIVSPHSQSTTMVFHMVRVLKEKGKLHLLKGIIIPEGAGTTFPNAGLAPSDFDTVPFLIVNGDYRADASRIINRAAVAAMNASPTRKVEPGDLRGHRDALGKKFNGA